MKMEHKTEGTWSHQCVQLKSQESVLAEGRTMPVIAFNAGLHIVFTQNETFACAHLNQLAICKRSATAHTASEAAAAYLSVLF